MKESRTQNVKKNIFYGYVGTILTSVLAVICRTVFVYALGAKYLGISGLFANVLGVLSFSELGIGSAIVFALYKPIAEDDTETIKSLLALYKKAYRVIAVIVASIGLAIIPFLKYLVKTDIPMSEINIFYFIFLFNTVSSYFITYKTSYVTAIQKEYILTITSTVGTITTSLVQIVFLLLGGQYLGYLLIASLTGLIQKVVLVLYLNSKYPILREKFAKPLNNEMKSGIWKNVRALIVHKIGDVSVHQTDNIIISSFISTTTVGLISNYTTLNSIIASFTNKFFFSFTASFGNMIAKESIETQRYIFDVYDLLGFWIYGFVMIAFITLSQPFITLWLGKNLLVDNVTMVLFFVSLYLAGVTVIPYNFKVAAGKFNEDKWVAFAQAITNLVVSIVAVKAIGLPGIYVGTITSRMIVVIVRPYVVYKYILKKSITGYYVRLILRTLLAICLCVLLWQIEGIILSQITIARFALMCIITLIIPNAVFLLFFGKTAAFKDILFRIRRR